MAAFDCVVAPQRSRVARDAGRGGYVASGDDATAYQVALVDGPGDELAFVRAVRTIARLSLAEALDIHAFASRTARATIVAGVPFATASQLVLAFEAADVAARIAPSSIETPMICRPRADEVRASAALSWPRRPHPPT